MNKLLRPRDGRLIAGVCAAIANFYGLNVAWIRLITLFLILLGGLSLWVYIIMWIIIPREY